MGSVQALGEAVGKAARVGAFLEDAKDFLERGFKELEEGIKLNDQFRIRDAAEKLWNAVINATNALILHYLGVVPASHWERRKLLEKLEDAIPKVEELGFRDRCGARERYLYETMFHDGIIDAGMLKKEVGKARKYVTDAENLTSAPRRASSRGPPHPGGGVQRAGVEGFKLSPPLQGGKGASTARIPEDSCPLLMAAQLDG